MQARSITSSSSRSFRNSIGRHFHQCKVCGMIGEPPRQELHLALAKLRRDRNFASGAQQLGFMSQVVDSSGKVQTNSANFGGPCTLAGVPLRLAMP